MTTLPGRILCLVTDIERAGSEAALIAIVRNAVSGGVNMVQVRGHELERSALERLTAEIVRAVGDEATVVVNGDPDVADAAGAAGVHFREAALIELPTTAARMLRGQSAHSLESAKASQDAGADYIILGTVFPSTSHPGGATVGTGLIRSVTGSLSIPVIGIGGITAENAGQVIAAGASGVAVISAIIEAPDPLVAAKALARAIDLSEHR